jgi:hypothetical protein
MFQVVVNAAGNCLRIGGPVRNENSRHYNNPWTTNSAAEGRVVGGCPTCTFSLLELSSIGNERLLR